MYYIPCIILLTVGFIVIFWAMVGYSFSLKLIKALKKDVSNIKNYDLKPTVTVMVVAHNEEKVILDKLKNVINLNYPKDKIKYLVASDNSTDKTNEIVRTFIEENKEFCITLYEVKERKGKTNAQNEAQKLVDTEFLVMTDANSIMDKNSVLELMSSFTDENIAYVTGKLVYINDKDSSVSKTESTYWDKDLSIREIESEIQTITAGNGAIYACRNKEYFEFNPIQCHDSAMPIFYALKGKRAIANHDAIAYEKAGEVIEDEFSRKVRMNRILLKHIMPDFRILNIFKYKWFSYFYFGHRTCRYLLWISHFILLLTSAILSFHSILFLLFFLGQILFYMLAIIKHCTKINNKYINLVYYYCVTIVAQWFGVYNHITGKSKPFWEKAESTR